MNSVLEIEDALRRMPLKDQREVARWLLGELRGGVRRHAQAQDAQKHGRTAPPLPDYSARRRRIFGSKVLPNMVLAARAEEPW